MNKETSSGGIDETGNTSPRTGSMGMYIFIVSLSAFFLVPIIGYLVVRGRAEQWPPEGMPSLPAGLWFSTIVILASSATLIAAGKSIRQGRALPFKVATVATLGLALHFLASQVINWILFFRAGVTIKATLYGFTFYALTGMHAVHVIGGLIPLAMITLGAFQRRYSAADHSGVHYAAIYWHFLTIVWLVMFFALKLTF